MHQKYFFILIDEGRGDGAEGRGRGEDYHHGQVSLVRKPPKKQFGGQTPEFPQPHWGLAPLFVPRGCSREENETQNNNNNKIFFSSRRR